MVVLMATCECGRSMTGTTKSVEHDPTIKEWRHDHWTMGHREFEYELIPEHPGEAALIESWDREDDGEKS